MAEPSKILNGLYLGNMRNANDVEVLKRLEISHILSVCPVRPQAFPDITYRHVPVNDLPTSDISQKFAECIWFIQRALSSGGTILVHCYAGVSRSATIVMAYLIKTKKLNFPEALFAVRNKRPIVSPNIGFINQLKRYAS